MAAVEYAIVQWSQQIDLSAFFDVGGLVVGKLDMVNARYVFPPFDPVVRVAHMAAYPAKQLLPTAPTDVKGSALGIPEAINARPNDQRDLQFRVRAVRTGHLTRIIALPRSVPG